ncbi:MAG: hypothetical protein V3V09_02490 [Arenicellales bacterium]
MNIIDKTDEEILEIANQWWDDLIENSNEGNYGKFVRNFSYAMCIGANEVEMGKQFAKSQLTKNLSTDPIYLGMIRRGEHVTVLYKQTNEELEGEWLGRLVLGYENDDIKIFGATIF